MSEHTHVFEPVGGLAVECECGAYFEGQEICDAVQGSYELNKLRALNEELLDTLQEVFNDLCQGAIPNADDSWWEKARAAIAKAKGESESPVTSEGKSE